MKIESNQGSLKSQLSSKTVQVQASVSKLITFDSWKMKKKRPYEHDQPSVLIFDMTGLKVARHEKKCQKVFCWHQNFILVFSGPSPGLYTYIKPCKILHKIKHEGDPSELYNKWSEWKRLSTTTKFCPWGIFCFCLEASIYPLNHEKLSNLRWKWFFWDFFKIIWDSVSIQRWKWSLLDIHQMVLGFLLPPKVFPLELPLFTLTLMYLFKIGKNFI